MSAWLPTSGRDLEIYTLFGSIILGWALGYERGYSARARLRLRLAREIKAKKERERRAG